MDEFSLELLITNTISDSNELGALQENINRSKTVIAYYDMTLRIIYVVTTQRLVWNASTVLKTVSNGLRNVCADDGMSFPGRQIR
jgi:hypothetical protein